jgi:hypothetical protein
MSMTIYDNGYISLDGVDTRISVAQAREGTRVFYREIPDFVNPMQVKRKYEEIVMPHPRYSLAHDAPASGVAGRAQFEADLRNFLKTAA